MSTKRGLRFLAILGVFALIVAACGEPEVVDEPTTIPAPDVTELPDEPEPEPETTTTQPEATTVRVTTLFVCSEAHLAWGINKGTFSANGVEIELVRTAGGAAGLAALVSGAADLSSTNPVSAILAVNQGFPIKIVSGSFSANPEGDGFAEGVVALADSGIAGPADLAGKKVAVNELGSQNHIFTQAWIRAAGVDPSDVNLLALPFPELVPALTDGRIDAALMTGAQVAQTVGPGTGVLIGNPLVDLLGPVPIATYIATDDFVDESPDALAGFQAGLAEAIQAVNDPANRDEVLAVMSEYCDVPVAPLQGVRFPAWEATVDPGVLSDIVDALVSEGTMPEPIDVSEILAHP